LRTQAVGGHEDIVTLLHVSQIDRAGVNPNGLPHLLDGDRQGSVQGRRSTDLLHDLPQRDKHG
jgi:hypothetical protein